MKNKFVSHILRHAWFWPIEFWMRPLTVIDRFEDAEWPEFFAALVGGGLWGALMGTVLWLINGDIHSIWVIMIVIAISCMITVLMGLDMKTLPLFASISTILGTMLTIILDIGQASVLIFVVSSAAIGQITILQIYREGASKAIYISLIYPMLFGMYFSLSSTNGIVPIIDLSNIAYVLITLGTIVFVIKIFNIRNNLLRNVFRFLSNGIWEFAFPVLSFVFFLSLPFEQTSIWGITLLFSLGISIISNFFWFLYFHRHQGFYLEIFSEPKFKIFKYEKLLSNKDYLKKLNKSLADHKFKDTIQSTFIWTFYNFFFSLALFMWVFSSLPDLKNLYILSIFLVFTPFIWTGLFFYPFMILVALWQYRSKQIKNFTVENFHLTAPFRWQSFAYPLPRLRYYLFQLGKKNSTKVAFNAIQQVQLWTLQMAASCRAAQDLANHPDTAISFCHEIAIQTNNATLLPLSTTGYVGRAVAILAKPQDKEDEQPLRLWVNRFQLKKGFQEYRATALSARLDYAQQQLKNFQYYQYIEEYKSLLTSLQQYAKIDNIGKLLSIAEQPISTRKCPKWLHGGWIILQKFNQQLTELKYYRQSGSSDARRQYLTRLQKKLEALEWDELPDYWANIGKELVEDWSTLLEKAKEQARNFLRLEIDLLQNSLLLGKQTLNLRVSNPTSVIAKKLYIQVKTTQGIFWSHRTAEHQFLESEHHTDLHLDCQIDTPGRYVIHGELQAQDLDSNLFKQPFAFQITVAESGRIYTEPDYQPYVTGAGLGNDRTFVGRTDLLAWLGSLWRQPDGKPTVVLIGQRRIGKTTLLNKIKRDGLERTRLIPVYIDTQEIGDTGELSFLTAVSERMAEAVGMAAPNLTSAPYLDFQHFLTETKAILDNRRFLLMIDESEPIFQGKFGSALPPFLRSLMQHADYPTLLLFCGTYFLKQVAWDYSSVFFNTAQFKTVSYLSAAESAELLQKPAREMLEFDEYVLEQAHNLTKGQPLLLQSLGANLIEEFNAIVRSGEERSNYVNFNDLEHATQVLVQQQDNMAFIDHWKNSDTATHRVLSALAWATDETNRPQLDIDGILAAMKENRLDLPRKPVFDIIQGLVDQEILERAGVTYRFAVPLYRRWIAWRWEPITVREEGLSDIS